MTGGLIMRLDGGSGCTDPVEVQLPSRLPGQAWENLATLMVRAAAGDPGGVPLPEPGTARCRCGQDIPARLRMRINDMKVVCTGCAEAAMPVEFDAPVKFFLRDSDLAAYVTSGYPRDTVMDGRVIMLRPLYREVAVDVPGWPIPHTVDVDQLVERPARLEDMRRFFVEATDEQVVAAYTAAVADGHTMTVGRGTIDEEEEL